jgi:hypothetical protein
MISNRFSIISRICKSITRTTMISMCKKMIKMIYNRIYKNTYKTIKISIYNSIISNSRFSKYKKINKSLRKTF